MSKIYSENWFENGLKSGLKFIKKFVEKCCKICLKFINILPIDKYEKNDMLYPRGAYILA